MAPDKGDTTPTGDSGSPGPAIDHRADEAIIPHDALDPVYEAKANVLNHAVRGSRHLDSRGKVSPDTGVALQST